MLCASVISFLLKEQWIIPVGIVIWDLDLNVFIGLNCALSFLKKFFKLSNSLGGVICPFFSFFLKLYIGLFFAEKSLFLEAGLTFF